MFRVYLLVHAMKCWRWANGGGWDSQGAACDPVFEVDMLGQEDPPMGDLIDAYPRETGVFECPNHGLVSGLEMGKGRDSDPDRWLCVWGDEQVQPVKVTAWTPLVLGEEGRGDV